MPITLQLVHHQVNDFSINFEMFQGKLLQVKTLNPLTLVLMSYSFLTPFPSVCGRFAAAIAAGKFNINEFTRILAVGEVLGALRKNRFAEMPNLLTVHIIRARNLGGKLSSNDHMNPKVGLGLDANEKGNKKRKMKR